MKTQEVYPRKLDHLIADEVDHLGKSMASPILAQKLSKFEGIPSEYEKKQDFTTFIRNMPE